MMMNLGGYFMRFGSARKVAEHFYIAVGVGTTQILVGQWVRRGGWTCTWSDPYYCVQIHCIEEIVVKMIG